MTAARSPGDAVLPPPTRVGETCTLTIRLDATEIRAFARQLHDLNPLHHDLAAARAAGYPGLIASGAHTGAIFMGMTATHFSGRGAGWRPAVRARARFSTSVFGPSSTPTRTSRCAGTVVDSVWKASLAGYLTRADGEARSARGLVLGGSATLLLRHA